MKKIYIIRHAKSSWKDLDMDDFDRPLKKRGKDDIKLVANWLKKRDIKPDIVLCSPAIRAKMTLKILKKVLDIKKEAIVFDRGIYMAKTRYLIELISDIDDRYDTLFLIGHNPSLSELAEYLCDMSMTDIPTSGVVAVKFDIDKWSKIKNKKGDMLFFVSPKKLKEENR